LWPQEPASFAARKPEYTWVETKSPRSFDYAPAALRSG
jgi:hypothetical protein